MSEHRGRFVWHELTTTHQKAATDFFTRVVGWASQDQLMPDMTYTLLSAGATQVAGLMKNPETLSNMRPLWTGYIAVDDVDEACDLVAELGGGVHRAPDDIPGIGRFSIVTDPGGASFALFCPMEGEPPLAPAGTPGFVGWNELYVPDVEKALGFYGAIAGWTAGEQFETDMGPYQLFLRGDEVLGGMMTLPEGMPQSAWMYYFTVSDIEAGARRVAEAGGRVLTGPMYVPSNQWIIHGMDPQGGVFALIGNKLQS